MKYTIICLGLICLLVFNCKSDAKKNEKIETNIDAIEENSVKENRDENDIKIVPISHGTMILEFENTVIYVDPVGGAEAFEGQKEPDIILITDIHGDHLNIETLEAINHGSPTIIAPVAVAEKLTDTLKTNVSVVVNGQSINLNGNTMNVDVEGIPMYNLREEALKFHSKGRGNGYVITLGGKRIYISGDTEDIPEMRTLKDIDIAFVCMNLPYTMTIESAASAVLDFKPKKIYPYHYRGTEGLSNVSLFKTLVNEKNKNIEVVLLDWYLK